MWWKLKNNISGKILSHIEVAQTIRELYPNVYNSAYFAHSNEIMRPLSHAFVQPTCCQDNKTQGFQQYISNLFLQTEIDQLTLFTTIRIV